MTGKGQIDLNTYTVTANQEEKDKFNRKMGEGYKQAVYIKETQVASKHLKIYQLVMILEVKMKNHEGPHFVICEIIKNSILCESYG